MKNMFQYVKDVCSTNVWSAANLKLYVPKAHPKSIQFSGPNIWNNLQPDARSAKSLCSFKLLYQKNNQNSGKVICGYPFCVYYDMLSVVCLKSIPCNLYIYALFCVPQLPLFK